MYNAVIGLVVLYFGFLVVAVIIWIIIQAITGGRGRARARDLPPNLAVGFVSFVCAMVVSLVQKLWTNFIRVLNSGNVGMGGGRAARRRSQLASTADTPRAAGTYVCIVIQTHRHTRGNGFLPAHVYI